MRCIESLLEAKRKIVHGDFLDWVRDECGITVMDSQRYMQIAGKFRAKSDIESHLKISGALKAIAQEIKDRNRAAREIPPKDLPAIGQRTAKAEKAKAGRPNNNRSDEATDYRGAPTLRDLGVTRDQSSQWQQLARGQPLGVNEGFRKASDVTTLSDLA
jgi:hypothetical protein